MSAPGASRSSVGPSAVAPSSEPGDCRRSTLSPGWASRRAAGVAVAIAWHQASAALGVKVMAEWLGVAGKRVVITGATSGIGLAAAEALAALGAKLTIVARNEAKASHAAARIQAAGRGAT